MCEKLINYMYYVSITYKTWNTQITYTKNPSMTLS